MPFDPTDYSVVVKLRAPPPNPWRWEIYRAGRANAIEQAAVFFPTMAAAGRAGKVALKELLDGRAAARGSVGVFVRRLDPLPSRIDVASRTIRPMSVKR